MNESIKNLQRKTNRYFYEDGLIEIGVGLTFALSGLAFALIPLIPGSLIWLVAFALPIVIAGGTVLTKAIVSRLKERIVYPRTGYVAHKSDYPAGRWLVIAGALAIGVLSFFLPENLDTIGLAMGGMLALVLAVIGGRVALPRLYAVAAVALIAGVGLTLAGIDMTIAAGGVFAITGVTMALTGLVAFMTYLRENPPEEGV